MMEEQEKLSGASSTSYNGVIWEAINWPLCEKRVHRLQMRIAKAIRDGRTGKAKALQWLLTHSKSAKLLAVKRVGENRGHKTAGVDKVILHTSRQKMLLADSLKRHGYKAFPLKRIYIPKKNGKQRPLGIPTIRDRVMQALYLLALEPIAETTADKDSYGFRLKRATADAIEQCFRIMRAGNRAQWVLEGDIKACFDRINHEWLLKYIPMDKMILKQWLSAGYIENQVLLPTEEGTPQGGIISPTLANMTLDGLEATIYKAVYPRYLNKVYVVRYADDFIVTAESKEMLEDKVKPAIIEFLNERGLELSLEKTRITHIKQGFDFLGFNVRKYDCGKLLIKPAKANIKAFMQEIRYVIKTNIAESTQTLLRQLNPKIKGWAHYYKHVVAKHTFSVVDNNIYLALRQWMHRRHPKKGRKWLQKKYFRSEGFRNWVFSTLICNKEGRAVHFDLFKMTSIPIKRHIKVRSEATPYDPCYTEYFKKREILKRTTSSVHWAHVKTQHLVGVR